jgi:hypothetical protein
VIPGIRANRAGKDEDPPLAARASMLTLKIVGAHTAAEGANVSHDGHTTLAAAKTDESELQVWRDSDGAVCAFGGSHGSEHWMHLPNLAVFQFGDGGHEVLALADPAAVLESIVDAYYRSVLPMALQALDTQVLHASAIRTCGGVVALCAVSGTGKSTLAFGLSRRGYAVWGDDAVAFKTSRSLVQAIPLPFAIRLRPAAASLFGVDPGAMAYPSPDAAAVAFPTPDPGAVAFSTPDPGAMAFPTRDRPAEADSRRSPLAALVVLERTPNRDAGVTVERLPAHSAFPAVLAHAYCFSLEDATRKRRMVEEYLRLTASVPTFRVRFAPGLERLDAVLDGIESVICRGDGSTITTPPAPEQMPPLPVHQAIASPAVRAVGPMDYATEAVCPQG